MIMTIAVIKFKNGDRYEQASGQNGNHEDTPQLCDNSLNKYLIVGTF